MIGAECWALGQMLSGARTSCSSCGWGTRQGEMHIGRSGHRWENDIVCPHERGADVWVRCIGVVDQSGALEATRGGEYFELPKEDRPPWSWILVGI
jgi:hypothetical protein